MDARGSYHLRQATSLNLSLNNYSAEIQITNYFETNLDTNDKMLRTTTHPYLLPPTEAFHCPKEKDLMP